MFAVLQSLGATGMGILIFGSITGAIGVLTPLVAQLGWCNGCGNDTNTGNADKEEGS